MGFPQWQALVGFRETGLGYKPRASVNIEIKSKSIIILGIFWLSLTNSDSLVVINTYLTVFGRKIVFTEFLNQSDL